MIDLRRKNLSIKAPFVTIAGQTAPSPGITLIRGGISIRTHDVRIQHIRVRPGDAGQPPRSGWEPDGISVSGAGAYNVHIDHCSVSWAVDENISVSGPRTLGPEHTARKVTISNSIIAEALDYASHRKGRHSKGLLVHDFAREVAVIGNLFAHNARRNPYFKANTIGVVANNLIYNPDSAAIQLGYIEDEWREAEFSPENPRVSVVGNLLYYGRDTYSDLALVAYQGDAFLENNRVYNLDDGLMNIVQGNIRKLDRKPSWLEGLTPRDPEALVEYLVNHAGARPKDRDPVDRRIIESFIARQGRIIDSQQQVGGYPKSEPSYRPLTVPEDVGAWLEKLARDIE
ncbi:right-handed parallel beta-helix repeat-containing protein [Microbulbifer thermotolerans]|uniref:right-handed parallel beta-helix repeat-containing protein n=1 Tax=Microbulbifer thermotolerans TaxID=252514 RepID=UPI00224959D5|nr:right-handed parallel beta-helix repeat-containing protein [Microbulbifer thermotolerans]MCX2832182.1 right-handed parallel beta-helix repeat-containing protein [Microbulbifer thermotolerans]